MKITLFAAAFMLVVILCFEGVDSQQDDEEKGPGGKPGAMAKGMKGGMKGGPGGKGGMKGGPGGKGGMKGPGGKGGVSMKGGGKGRTPNMERVQTGVDKQGRRYKKVSRSFTFGPNTTETKDKDEKEKEEEEEKEEKEGKEGKEAMKDMKEGKDGKGKDGKDGKNGKGDGMMMMMMNGTGGMNGSSGNMSMGGGKFMPKPDKNKSADELISEVAGLITEQFVRVGGDLTKQGGLTLKDAGVDAVHIIQDAADILKGAGKKKKGKKGKGGKDGKKKGVGKLLGR